MKYRKRIYYTEKQKALMWDRWQEGDSLREIARLFDRRHSSVRGIFERSGGMRGRRLAEADSIRTKFTRRIHVPVGSACLVDVIEYCHYIIGTNKAKVIQVD